MHAFQKVQFGKLVCVEDVRILVLTILSMGAIQKREKKPQTKPKVDVLYLSDLYFVWTNICYLWLKRSKQKLQMNKIA